MAPKRGMSLEDKRKTLLSIFHETKSAFLLKDIEKLGAKRGVVLQSIKDVLQSLVDDDLVNMEKIGERRGRGRGSLSEGGGRWAQGQG